MNIEQLKLIIEIVSQLSDNALLGFIVYMVFNWAQSITTGIIIIIAIIKIAKIIANLVSEKNFIQYIFRMVGENEEYWDLEMPRRRVIDKLEQKLGRKKQ